MGDQYPQYEPPSEPDPERSPGDPAADNGAPDPFGFRPLDQDDLLALGFVPAHPGAMAASVMGGASLFLAVMNLFCCFTGLISLVLGPLAIVRGLRARREIDAQPGRYGNRGMATTAIVTGTLGTLGGALTTALYLAYVGLAFNTGYVY
jgi:hypothetical protein